MGLEELPSQISQNVQEAVEQERQQSNDSLELEKQRIKIERERIKAEERIAERQAEKEETIARGQYDPEIFRPFFDDLLSRISELVSRPSQTIEVDASHAQNEVPSAIEDAPAQAVKTGEEAEENAVEGIEEIGGKVEDEVAKGNDVVEESVDNNESNRNSGRRKKRRRR